MSTVKQTSAKADQFQSQSAVEKSNQCCQLHQPQPRLRARRKQFLGLDRRFAGYKAASELSRMLINSLGGDVSPQRELLINNFVFDVHPQILYFRQRLWNNEALSPEERRVYCYVIDQGKSILKTIGMDRLAKELDLSGALIQLNAEVERR